MWLQQGVPRPRWMLSLRTLREPEAKRRPLPRTRRAAVFEHAGPDVDLAIYNAGNNTPGRILEMEADYSEKSWRVVCNGGFLFGREALRRMVPRKRGTILFTGASASLRGRAGYGAFNSAKAGLRTLAQAMAKENGPGGHPCRPCRRRRCRLW
jgi:NAD(P)-dependent dehydrogenase (short-subunit alcohol dehydrogenase family)